MDEKKSEGMNMGNDGEGKRQDGSSGFIMQEPIGSGGKVPYGQQPASDQTFAQGQQAPYGQQSAQGQSHDQQYLYQPQAPQGQQQTDYGQQAPYSQQPVQGEPAYSQQAASGISGYGQPQTFYGQQASNEQQAAPRQEGPFQQPGAPKNEKGSNGPLFKKKISRRAKTVIAVVVAVVLATGCGFGGAMAAMYVAPSLIPTAQNNVVIKPSDSVNTGVAVAKKVMPSVVGISTTEQQNVQTFFGPMTQQVQGVGTGIIVDAKGYILTNSHVVDDGKSQTLTVQLYDGREIPGTVLWNDPGIDLAIVKVDAPNLQPAELGNSDDMQVGDYAAAIGNPMGLEYARSMSQGIISGLNRNVTVQKNGNPQGSTMEGLIQTDASINGGNSGGPLLNDKGQVIGINTAKADGGEGMGFAIPINTAKPIVDEIKEKGEFQRSYIGIGGLSVSNIMQMYPNVKVDSKTGVYIIQIYTNSPASVAGLKEGDIITGLNGNKIDSMQELTSKLFQYRPGDKVTLDIVRDNAKLQKEVTLTASVDQGINNLNQQGANSHQ